MRRFAAFLFGIALLSALWSCENCGPSAEPLTTLHIQTPSLTRLDTVYAPGSLRPLPAQPYSTTASTQYHELILPINLTADSTRYVVQFEGQRDTITVYYRRQTEYKSRNCGYVLDLYEPRTGSSVRTTRGEVTYVYHVQNKEVPFPYSDIKTGIFVSVRL